VDTIFQELTIANASAAAVVLPAYAAALCAGHFPGNPLIPGASLARLMAALARALVGTAEPAVLVRCTFHLRVTPEDRISVSARLDQRGTSGTEVTADVRVRDRCAARARFRFGETV
jgi:3-hydroxymyristoyl/3-hydroxydecanoyl-(acyl carrier protein) dehydratase